MKTCTNCKQEKALSEYKKNKRAKSGLDSWCKTCCSGLRVKNHAAYRKTERARELAKYGLTLEDYDNMRKEQDYNCKICKKHESLSYREKLFVDHCHTTGKVRSLLCDKCNAGLGNFKDSAEFLKIASEYLIRHRS